MMSIQERKKALFYVSLHNSFSFLCTALCQLRCAIAVTVYTAFTLIFPGCCFRHIHSHMENGFAVFERANLFVIHRQTIPQVVVHCVQYTVGAHLLSEHSEHTATIM